MHSTSKNEQFPFSCKVSLDPLVSVWQEYANDCPNNPFKVYADSIISDYSNHPDLQGIIQDTSILKEHEDILQRLFSLVIAYDSQQRDLISVMPPFTFEPFYQSESFKNLIEGKNITGLDETDIDPMNIRLRVLHAYCVIFRDLYGYDLDLDFPVVHTIQDPQTGLFRCYQLDLDTRFVQVKATGALPQVDMTMVSRLLQSVPSPDELIKLVPPAAFEFSGFVISRGVEVTEQQMLSAIKKDLIDSNSIKSGNWLNDIRLKLSSLFGKADIEMHISAISGNQLLSPASSDGHSDCSCIYMDSDHQNLDYYKGTMFEKAYLSGNPLVISDCSDPMQCTENERRILTDNVQSILIAPLPYNGSVVGILSLKSSVAGTFSAIEIYRLRELIPLFALAVQHSLDDFENRIRLIIQDKCTAIHPSVFWRFRDAAITYTENESAQKETDFEQVVFVHVFPLYAATDIRGSSTHRNSAIQQDLVEDLNMVKSIVVSAAELHPLPVLDELLFRVDRNLGRINDGLSSGDEIEILNFMRREVEPSFPFLRESGDTVAKMIDDYLSLHDREFGMIYRRRRDFDQSVEILNRKISAFLEQSQEDAQRMFPHYFEKQSTDGVDFSMYIGQSLVNDRHFDRMYLINLRLWQLMVVCKIARLSEKLKSELPLPLETTHLIMVQDMPITISFPLDEKRFHVEGAYNIRYEIMKKRIDKAIVRDTGERLTQPGKIAIVYSQLNEAREYLNYLEYLQNKGFVQNEVEDLELDDLQGIRGLKALRCEVVLQGDISTASIPGDISGYR